LVESWLKNSELKLKSETAIGKRRKTPQSSAGDVGPCTGFNAELARKMQNPGRALLRVAAVAGPSAQVLVVLEPIIMHLSFSLYLLLAVSAMLTGACSFFSNTVDEIKIQCGVDTIDAHRSYVKVLDSEGKGSRLLSLRVISKSGWG
jgi:hypothetical protein